MFTNSKITEIINKFEDEAKGLIKDETLSKELSTSIEKMKQAFQTLERDEERRGLQMVLCKYGHRTRRGIKCHVFKKAFSVHSMKTVSFSNIDNIVEQIFEGKAVYEVIPELRRLYLDIDSAVDTNQVITTIESFIRYLNRSYRLEPGCINYIASRNDQSRHKGLSSHVIFNIVCDYKFQRYLIRDFIMKTGCTIIDPLPYAKCQQLRIPYSKNPMQKYTEFPNVFNDGTRKPNEFKIISRLFKSYKHPPVRCQDFHYIWLSTYPSTYNKAIPYFCSDLNDCLYIDRVDDNKIAEMHYSADDYFDSKFLFADDQMNTIVPSGKSSMVKQEKFSSMKVPSSTVPKDKELTSSLSSMDIPLGLISPRLSKFEQYYRRIWKHENSYEVKLSGNE